MILLVVEVKKSIIKPISAYFRISALLMSVHKNIQKLVVSIKKDYYQIYWTWLNDMLRFIRVYLRCIFKASLVNFWDNKSALSQHLGAILSIIHVLDHGIPVQQIQQQRQPKQLLSQQRQQQLSPRQVQVIEVYFKKIIFLCQI